MKKKIVILDNNHGQCANQLWSYMSIYAYCLERGYSLSNPSFGDYRKYFSQKIQSPVVDAVFFSKFKKNKFVAFLRPYYRYAELMKKLKKNQIYYSGLPNRDIFYLPPSKEVKVYSDELSLLEKSGDKTLYFCGGRFRNPIGITKYHSEIVDYFRPSKIIEESITLKMTGHRSKYSHIVGVHIRLKDFRTDKQGHLVEPERFVPIMREYLEFKKVAMNQTLFIICSDEKIDPTIFKGLNVVFNDGNLGEDLFTLSSADAIIGSNSSFGAFAGYYGNIPFMVVDNVPFDWQYYEGKDAYFENKYGTVVKY